MTGKFRWKIAVSGLLIGATVGGCSSLNLGGRTDLRSAAPAQSVLGVQDVGAHLAVRAQGALTAGKTADAVNWAEAAVIAEPLSGAYRVLLGQAYLQDGRFSAAAMALSEAAELDAVQGDAVVALALAKIAEGDAQGAVDWLSHHSDGLTASDLGLALALAGDHAGSLYVLGNAVREPDATAQTRQNFSLALALAGRWAQARLVAVQDLPLNRVEKRMLEFSSIASAADKPAQIASLMGIKKRSGEAMPAQLALKNFQVQGNGPAMAAASVTRDAPVAQAAMGAAVTDVVTPVVADDPVALAVADVEIVPDVAASPLPSPTVMAMVAALDDQPVRHIPAAEIVPAAEIPPAVMMAAFEAPAVGAAPAAVATPVVAVQPELAAVFAQSEAAAVAVGNWSVQVASLDSADNARLAWYDLTARAHMTARYAASTHLARVGKRTYYRLTLDGLTTRAEAQQLCNRLQAVKQDCFVRQQNGAENALWAVRAQKNVQMASR